MPNMESFRTELVGLLNRHTMENGSNTSDFILAKYLAKCLVNLDETVVARDTWYGVRATGISLEELKGGGEAVPGLSRVGGEGDGAGVGGPPSRKLEPGDVAAAKGALDALNVLKAGDLRSLSDDEERDWRTFAFAKTQEGSVWERASVQRLFATIDKQKAAKAECERQLQESFDRYGAALEDVNTLREDRDAASKKWQDYERDFILPCFRWARELGLDLEQMVLDSPGHNCVELLVSTLRDRFTKIVDLVEKVAQAHDELAERHPNSPDKFKAEALRRFAEVWLSGNVPITSLTELREKGLR